MDPYIFEYKGFALRWYTLLILIGVFLGFKMVEREGRRFGIDKDFMFNLCFWTVIVGILGARIYYVIFNFSYYKEDFLSMFRIWEGGLAIHGGIIAGTVASI